MKVFRYLGYKSVMDLDVKLKGLSENKETNLLFKNNSGKEFDISGLSSGEKHFF